ncbi:hypothetical protein [Streptomyces sp. NPDC054952]
MGLTHRQERISAPTVNAVTQPRAHIEGLGTERIQAIQGFCAVPVSGFLPHLAQVDQGTVVSEVGSTMEEVVGPLQAVAG